MCQASTQITSLLGLEISLTLCLFSMRLRKQTEHACLKKVANNASDVLAGSG
jgi:hypothetical protein